MLGKYVEWPWPTVDWALWVTLLEDLTCGWASRAVLPPVSPTSPRHWMGSGTCLRDRGKDVFYFYSFIELKGEPDFH